MQKRTLTLLLLCALLPLSPAHAESIPAPYIISGGNLYELHAGEPPALRYIAPYVPDESGTYRKATIDGVQPSPDGTLTLNVAGERIIIDAQPLNRTLRVYLGDGFPHEMIAAYQQQNPFLDIQIIRQWPEPAPCDIYPITSEGSPSMQAVRSARNMLPLDQSPAITAAHAAYQPLAQAVLSYENGAPFAVPTRLFVYTWAVDWPMWQAMGLDESDLPTTADDLFALLEIWNDQYAALYPERVLLGDDGFGDFKASLLHLLTYQAIFEMDDGSAPLNFDTPAYRALVERVAALPDGLPTARIDQQPPVLRWLHYGLSPGIAIQAPYRAFLPPAMGIGEGMRIGARLYGVSTPTDAPNQPLALDFLAFAATHFPIEQPDPAFAPHLTFHTNALGGGKGALDLAEAMMLALDLTGHTPRPALWADRRENLIAQLNRMAAWRFDRMDEPKSWYAGSPGGV
jgi:hypothetical protein